MKEAIIALYNKLVDLGMVYASGKVHLFDLDKLNLSDRKRATMKVFIENERNRAVKNIFNERTLTYIESRAVSAPYPYPYGFVLETLSGDGDCLDCFVLTDKPLKTADIVEVEPIALMEMREDDEIDHKVIGRLLDEDRLLTQEVKGQIADFIQHVFSHIKGKRMVIGGFLPREKALEFIAETRRVFKESDETK